jgi:hypothetical protein
VPRAPSSARPKDHFQADFFHYAHHRYFECNYAGSDAAFMDVWFDTFVGSFEEREKDKGAKGVGLREDAKSTLRQVPTLEFLAFLAGSSVCVLAWAQAALAVAAGGAAPDAQRALALAALPGFGPVALAVVMSLASARGVKPAPMSLAANAFHLAVGTAFCSLPVSWACWLALQPRGA